MSEAEFLELRRQHETAKADAERAQGALSQLMSQLKEDHECDTLEEAKSLLTRLEKKLAQEEKVLTQAIAEYQAKWNDHD